MQVVHFWNIFSDVTDVDVRDSRNNKVMENEALKENNSKTTNMHIRERMYRQKTS